MHSRRATWHVYDIPPSSKSWNLYLNHGHRLLLSRNHCLALYHTYSRWKTATHLRDLIPHMKSMSLRYMEKEKCIYGIHITYSCNIDSKRIVASGKRTAVHERCQGGTSQSHSGCHLCECQGKQIDS